jgi:hypothetical protein
VAVQPADHQITWDEFKLAFREHYIPEGVLHMKQEEFMKLKQGGDTVTQYLNKFNHLSQYAIDQVNTDIKKKNCFMRGLNDRMQKRWPLASTLLMEGMSAQHWQSRLNMQVLENPRGMEATSPIRAPRKGKGWLSDLSIRIVFHHAHPPSHSNNQCLSVLPPAPTTTNQPGASGTRFPALPSSSTGCFNYGKSGHFIKDCPYLRQNQSNNQQSSKGSKGNAATNTAGKNTRKTGWVYYTQVATTPGGEPVMMGTFLMANHPALILFDSDASHTFISKKFVEKHCIPYTESREGFKIHSPGGQIFTKEVAYQVPVTLAGRDFPTSMIVLKGQDIDVILGMNWLAQHKAILNTDLRTIGLSYGQEEILVYPHSHSS